MKIKTKKISKILLVLALLAGVACFAANAQVLGDTNHDGNVTIIDAMLTAQYAAGLAPNPYFTAQGDVNCDGLLNINDALLIAQYSAGLRPAFSCSVTVSPTPTPTQGPIWSGGPYSLNGTSDFVDLPDGINSNLSDFSIACWVRLNAVTNWVRIFDFGGDTNIFMMLTPKSGTTGFPYFAITTSGNSGEQGINGTSTLPVGSWQHLVVVKSGTTGILYINKQEVGRNANMTLTPADVGYTEKNYIGRSQWAQDPYLNANIDKFLIYNRALSTAEVTVLGNDVPANVTPTPTPTPTPTRITPTPTSTTAKFHIFLLLGQSNMAGYPKPDASDRVEDPRIKVLGYDECSSTGRHADQWDIAAPPLHGCFWDSIGPGDWFAKTIISRLPANDTIGLIPCAISGEKIETFMKSGGSKYTWIINRCKMAQQAGGIIEGFLFHQGESNSGQSDWPGKVKTFVTDLRTDLGIGNVPFLAGELLYSGGCAGHNTLVNQLPSLITNCYVISASGLVVDPADTQYRLHFGHDSQVTFGQRYAQKMLSVLGW